MTPRREQQRYKVTTIVIAVTTLLVSCGALLLFLMWARHPETTVYCSTADCLRHVTELKEAMDTSVDPCDDFYRYTCGSWKPNHKEHSMVARMFDHMTKIAIEEMEGPSDKALVPKALDFFKNCAQPRNLTAADVRTFVDFKQNLGFYWPEKKQPASDALFSLLNMTINWKINFLFSLRALPAYKHRPQTLHVSRGILKRAWVDPTWTPQTFAEVVRLHCHLLGSEAPSNAWDVTVLKTTVEDIIGATLATPPEATGKSKLFALKEIEELMPKRADDWLSSLNRLHSPQFTWTLDSPVILEDEAILQNLQLLLKKYDEKKQTLMEGLSFVLIRSTMWLLAGKPELRHNVQPEVGLYIWKRACLTYTAGNFGLLVAAKHIYARYTSTVRGELEDFYHRIQAAVKQQLEDAAWIDDTTKHKVVAKIDELTLDAVPEDLFFSEDNLARLYKDFPVIESSFMDNFIAVAATYRHLIGDDSFFSVYSKGFGDGAPSRYNYYYNTAYISLSAMEPPILYLNGTMAMAYGSFGTLIAESMVRSFDKQGVRVNTRGDEELWWDSAAYTERVSCDFLSDTTSGDHREARVSALFPLAPALNASFAAHRKSFDVDEHVHWRLEGLDYNDDQMFFLTYCLMTCAVNSTGESCNVPLRQLDKFASTFHCQRNSPMNPSKKCTFFQ
ncbi:neprilysin-like [Rhipicephalus microplus]|uniref:neprilysin-like n=1 Tax=Rhipicephalus microplus TaxID=6941 RepID=UPI003F6D2C3A